MWRRVASRLILSYVILGVVGDFFDAKGFLVEGRYFSEGGGFDAVPQGRQGPQGANVVPINNDYQNLVAAYEAEQAQKQARDQELAEILDELYAREVAAEQEKAAQELARDQLLSPLQVQAEQPAQQGERESDADAVQRLSQLSQQIKQLADGVHQQQQQPVETVSGEVEPQAVPQTQAKQPTAQKKGQNEFVEFVEPVPSKVLKNMDSIEKRKPFERSTNEHRGMQLLSTSGNIMFIAIVTMCCVVAVAGVVGGMYYYNNVRKGPENDFDDFTRYSPAGPAKKLHGLRNGVNGVRMDENGDDSLAYKAQLHHYQQTKQKIIGAEDGLSGATSPARGSPRSIHHGENSEDEAEDLEEHNYSVYECPGLAPTGDIEVANPNFGH